MNIKELFQNANKSEAVDILASKYKIRSFLKILSLEKTFTQIAKFNTENNISEYCYMYMPYYNAYSSEADTDSFFTKKSQLASVYNDFDSPQRVLLIGRVIPEELTLDEILNADICPLSLKNYSKEELCADILWELLFYNQTLTGRENAINNFINNTKQLNSTSKKSERQFHFVNEDAETNIAKNILASYPYYQSALKMIKE